MSPRVSAGSAARPGDRRAARATLDLLPDEVTRVRAAALAWRNGLGVLLAGLIGFGLLKGRSDVTQLSPGYATVVGVLLLGALLAGAAGALALMRAAYGLPWSVGLRRVVDRAAPDPGLKGRRTEAHASALALTWGVVFTLGCTLLLGAAVGLTWYGPEKDKPRVEVRLTTGTSYCGEVVSTAGGKLTLKTPQGQVVADLAQADGLRAGDACPTAPPP